MATVDVTTKVCTKCHVRKPLDGFYFNKAKGTHVTQCRACQREYQRAYEREMHRLARGNRTASVGRLRAHEAEKTMEQLHRDDAAAALFAASRRWVESSDREDRAGALDAVVLRATQFLQAHGRCGA